MEAEFHLRGIEIDCVKKLAEMFEKGDVYVTANIEDTENNFLTENQVTDQLNVPPEKRAAVLETMESMGLIDEVTHSDSLRYLAFRITSNAVQAARKLEAKLKEESEPEDLVEKIKSEARKIPAIAWTIIVFVTLAAIVTLINQGIELLQNLRLIPKP